MSDEANNIRWQSVSPRTRRIAVMPDITVTADEAIPETLTFSTGDRVTGAGIGSGRTREGVLLEIGREECLLREDNGGTRRVRTPTMRPAGPEVPNVNGFRHGDEVYGLGSGSGLWRTGTLDLTPSVINNPNVVGVVDSHGFIFDVRRESLRGDLPNGETLGQPPTEYFHASGTEAPFRVGDVVWGLGYTTGSIRRGTIVALDADVAILRRDDGTSAVHRSTLIRDGQQPLGSREGADPGDDRPAPIEANFAVDEYARGESTVTGAQREGRITHVGGTELSIITANGTSTRIRRSDAILIEAPRNEGAEPPYTEGEDDGAEPNSIMGPAMRRAFDRYVHVHDFSLTSGAAANFVINYSSTDETPTDPEPETLELFGLPVELDPAGRPGTYIIRRDQDFGTVRDWRRTARDRHDLEESIRRFRVLYGEPTRILMGPRAEDVDAARIAQLTNDGVAGQ